VAGQDRVIEAECHDVTAYHATNDGPLRAARGHLETAAHLQCGADREERALALEMSSRVAFLWSGRRATAASAEFRDSFLRRHPVHGELLAWPD
jgi:hypothetical protein